VGSVFKYRVVARLENLENLQKSGNLILPWKTWKNQGISLLCLEKRFFSKINFGVYFGQ